MSFIQTGKVHKLTKNKMKKHYGITFGSKYARNKLKILTEI